jgi:hypothetical protein
MSKIPLEIGPDRPELQGLRILARIIARAYLARQREGAVVGRKTNDAKSNEEAFNGTSRARAV